MAGNGNAQPHPVDRWVGLRMSERRNALGFNQTELAKALGLTFQQIQKYEHGANRISSSRLWEISKFLQVEIGYFFEGLSDQPPARAETSAVSLPLHTRQTMAISELALHLGNQHQRLALELIQALVLCEAPGDEPRA